ASTRGEASGSEEGRGGGSRKKLLFVKMKPLAVLIFTFVVEGLHRVAAYTYCGVDLEDAKNTCWQPCNSDSDCCSLAQRCFETGSSCGSSDLSGPNHNFCGASWCSAAYQCGTPCPDLEGCPEGESCFADIPCDSNSPVTAPPLPAPPTAAPYQFCGSSASDADQDCWQPCPGGDSNCCLGLKCFDTSLGVGTCASPEYSGSSHFSAGQAGAMPRIHVRQHVLGAPMRSVPVDRTATLMCLVLKLAKLRLRWSLHPTFSHSAENAAENCWQPCRDNDDCCYNQTCHSGVTACAYPDNIGGDHYFCGTDYCDASFSCSEPCPTGFDAECPNGQRCVANTPCNANIESESANFLRYGLPQSALLLRQYRPVDVDQGQVDADQGQANMETSPGNNPFTLFPVGLIFGICAVGLIIFNLLWSKRNNSK
ncbi:hypothetical protein ACHAWF_005498, partial [Thalassiosira exigua]